MAERKKKSRVVLLGEALCGLDAISEENQVGVAYRVFCLKRIAADLGDFIAKEEASLVAVSK